MTDQELSAKRCIVAEFVEGQLTSWSDRLPLTSQTVLSRLSRHGDVPYALELSRDDPWCLKPGTNQSEVVLHWPDGAEVRFAAPEVADG